VDIIIGIVGVVLTGLGTYYTYLGYKKNYNNINDKGEEYEESQRDLFERLIKNFWDYPNKGGSYSSWAVKESLVLKGKLDEAKEKPGLGIAIVTTEFALQVYDDNAYSRIDKCISWALSHSISESDGLLSVEQINPITQEVRYISDFRHTLALAIILARSGKLKDKLKKYLLYVLENQNIDGGWSAGKYGDSELFTVVYAVELLTLCIQSPELFDNDILLMTREKALDWIVSRIGQNGMWCSGYLSEYEWDDIDSTSWIIHRLMGIYDISRDDWGVGITTALINMVYKSLKPDTWRGTGDLQRFRVEARVFSAVQRVVDMEINNRCQEELKLYLSDWRERSINFAKSIDSQDWDIATIVFYLQSVCSLVDIKEYSAEIGLL
jgi:hypothetical protein